MAIAFDASASNGANGAGGTNPLSTTVSHTIGGGSNRLVVVACEARSNAITSIAFTTVTYNGVAMTQAVTISDVGVRNISSIYYLLESSLPAAGTYNVVVTATGTGGGLLQTAAAVYSFTGAKQSAQPDATNTYTDAVGGASISKSITTVATDSWIVDCLAASAASGFTGTAVAAGSQAHAVTQAPAGAGPALQCASTLGPINPAASTATGWGTFGGANPSRWAYAQASFSPAASGTNTAQSMTVTSTQLATMQRGVGKLISVTSTATPTSTRSVAKIVTVTSTQTPTIVKVVTKTFATVSTGTATIARGVGKVLASTSTATATAVRGVGKILGTTCSGALAFTRGVGKGLSVTATGTPSFVRNTAKTLATTCAGTASMLAASAARAFFVTLDSVSTATATCTKNIRKTLSAGARRAAAIFMFDD